MKSWSQQKKELLAMIDTAVIPERSEIIETVRSRYIDLQRDLIPRCRIAVRRGEEEQYQLDELLSEESGLHNTLSELGEFLTFRMEGATWKIHKTAEALAWFRKQVKKTR